MNLSDTKSFFDSLSFGVGSKLPITLQTEATECGLACLAMVAWFHGYRSDLSSLRRRFPVSLKGSTLADVMQNAECLRLAARPLKLDLEHLSQIRLPCILHWDFNHFVVLKEVGEKFVTIHDPAIGIRRISMQDVSKSFTGVALELWPATDFRPRPRDPKVPLTALMGHVSGLRQSLGQILVLALALEIFALMTPFFMQYVIDEVLVGADRNLLATLAVSFLLVMLLQQAVTALRSWAILYLGTTLGLQWRANVFAHLVRLPVQYFQKRHMGDVISRFEAVERIRETLSTSFIEAILDGLMTLVTLILMFMYSPALTWIAVAAMFAYMLIRAVFHQPLHAAFEEEIVHAAKQESHFLETVRGIKTVKLFGRQEERRLVWLSTAVQQTNAHLRMEKLRLLYKLLNGVIFGLENVLVVWLGAGTVLDGGFSAGLLIAFIAYKTQFSERVTGLTDKIFDVRMLGLQCERLADIVLAEPEAHAGAIPPARVGPLEPSIEINALDFRYSDNEPLVLEDIALKIEAGESVAIVGPSGGGKTTLIHLMLGMLTPVSGSILVGGVNIRALGAGALRAMIGTVMQDDVLFAGSIADNICFFDINADRAWIEACAKAAAVHEDIEAMPMEYNTLVGDMGTVLSGGQKQRILLARALYRRPAILFLDEATSHLDVEREKQVNTAIKELKMTRIIVAHRPETIAMAERVFHLEQGMLTEIRTTMPSGTAAETPEPV